MILNKNCIGESFPVENIVPFDDEIATTSGGQPIPLLIGGYWFRDRISLLSVNVALGKSSPAALKRAPIRGDNKSFGPSKGHQFVLQHLRSLELFVSGEQLAAVISNGVNVGLLLLCVVCDIATWLGGLRIHGVVVKMVVVVSSSAVLMVNNGETRRVGYPVHYGEM